MKIHHVTQGSPEWTALRIGIPTASAFDKIITPAKGQLSKSSRPYAFLLVAEQLLGRTLDSLEGLEWIERGKELEPQAVRMYEFAEDCETAPVGFITSDDGRMGASPDRLIVGARAGLEIKCPAPQTHLGYMIDGFGDAYKTQVQGQMLIGDFDYVDRFSFHPELPPYRERTHRDEPFIALMRSALNEFCDMKDAMLDRVRASGFFEERERVKTAVDAAIDEWRRTGAFDGDDANV